MKKLCDAAVKEVGMEKRVVFTGFIPDEELDSLLRRADFLIYPSLYEGFGIPILEAMQVGIPVITSDLAAMPEVAGGAAILVDPYNIEEMASEMANLLQDNKLREELSQKGVERASLYSWQRTAERYLELYGEKINSHSARS
jgi:glycosyltransferase involved in cell wall biosynthesis